MRSIAIISSFFAAAIGCSHDTRQTKSSPESADDDSCDAGTRAAGRVYIESNDPAANMILGFARGDDGSLSVDAVSTTRTGGVGLTAGPNQRLGPLDSDQEIVTSADGRFLLAVNSGDHTISKFSIAADGALTLVGSPVDSGGLNPVSIGVDGDFIHVVNKAADGSVPPSYTTLALRGDALQLLPRSTFEDVLGASPTIAYVHPDRQMLFGTEFLDGARPMQAPVGQIDAFLIGENGALSHAPGSPYALPPDTSGIMPPLPAVALNLIANPKDTNILYVAFPTRNQVGVYQLNPNCHALEFVRTVPNSGKAVCWFLIDDASRYMYTVNSASGTISTYDLSDPLAPVELGALELKQDRSGRPYIDAMGMMQTITSQPFELAFDADRSHIYVISQRATTNADDPLGNYLHTLVVGADGTLGEPSEPIDLLAVGVPSAARPQGVLVR